MIYSHMSLSSTDMLRGAGRIENLADIPLKVIGGEYNGMKLQANGMPEFRQGEDFILFLKKVGDRYAPVRGEMGLIPLHPEFEKPTYRWSGSSPLVYYKTSSSLDAIASLGVDDERDIVRDAAGDWFKIGQSNFSYYFAGSDEQNKPSGLEKVLCVDGQTQIKVINIFDEKEDDPDCSGSICAFVWSCSESAKIAHGDIQINSKDFSWNDASTSTESAWNLKANLSHAFGHLLGLHHCGYANDGCTADDFTDPSEDDIMNKFPHIGKLGLSANDISELHRLYGAMDVAFPVDGPYVLTDEEVYHINEYNSLMIRAGYDNDQYRSSMGRGYDSLIKYHEEKEGRTIEEETESYFSKINDQIPSYTKEELIVTRNLSTLGALMASRMIQAVDDGVSPLDRGFLINVLEKHMSVREAAIDRLEVME